MLANESRTDAPHIQIYFLTTDFRIRKNLVATRHQTSRSRMRDRGFIKMLANN